MSKKKGIYSLKKSGFDLPQMPRNIATGRYTDKRVAPCMECCGDKSNDCAMISNCDFWREYTFRRKQERKREFERKCTVPKVPLHTPIE